MTEPRQRPLSPPSSPIEPASAAATATIFTVALTTVAIWLGSLALPGCRVDEAEFNQRVFACNIASPDPGCGTDEDGKPMACFAARQIGATDFCAKTCDVAAAPSADAVCLASAVSLRACKPSDDDDPTGHPLGACDRTGLACYRTDLLSDDGVCTTMNPCDADTDCRDPVRSVCATTFLANLYAGATELRRDHSYCLQTGCRSRGTSCSPGETCLQEVIAPEAHPPDICVPNCDSQGQCPPNFLCYSKVSTAIAPNVCIPGLLGFTCDSSIDCMLGTCVDTGIGYKVCTTGCDDDAQCRQFDGVQGKFVCIKNPGNPTEPGYCHTPDAYRGSICNTTSECTPRNAEEECSRFDPKDLGGTCLLPCPADGKCKPRAGINHTCLPSLVRNDSTSETQRNVCFPGYFGLPCAADANCVGDLTCHPTVPGAPSVCTISCGDTADCAADRWVGGDGWCHPQLKICLSTLDAGEDCAGPEACKSKTCLANKCASTGEEGE